MKTADSIMHKLQIFGFGLAIMAGLVLLSMFFTNLGSSSAEASRINSASISEFSSLTDSPNVVADGFARLVGSLDSSLASVNRSIETFGSSFGENSQQLTQNFAKGSRSALHATGSGISTLGIVTGNSIVFVLRIPENTFGYLGDTKLVSAVIRPSSTDNEPVPIIDPNSPALFAARTALPAAPKANVETAIWPLHGTITTEFGANDWPYQAVHTGIDISDGQWAGTTPVHPFRAGRVISVIHSTISLGNHVVIDHGNGVTSVYGHLASVNVTVGQQVDQTSVVGFEGTTGASTGTHLHFEIRVNGQAANPHQFINGQP
jgi:murein DD-endopeptidase MepM/ murein hydrolase activator NlpD